MAKKTKYYVVWRGFSPGVYDTWEECQAQVEGFPGAKYRAYGSAPEAVEAFRKEADDASLAIFEAMAHMETKPIVNYSAFPEIRTDAIAVDGACAGNPGLMEYRGVRVATGEELFRVGPLPGGTNNVAEYLAIIHAAAQMARDGDTTTPIYSDSRTARAWVRGGHSRTSLQANTENTRVFEILRRADAWLSTHRIPNPILTWETDSWGEIPADFGRK